MASGTITNFAIDSGTGYCKMPDGTLIQWGTAPNTSSGYAEITTTIAFSSRNYTIISTPRYGTGSTARDYGVLSSVTSSTTAIIYFRGLDGATYTDTNASVFWIAIGRWK